MSGVYSGLGTHQWGAGRVENEGELTFIKVATTQEVQLVVFKFVAPYYARPETEAFDPTLITYRGQTGSWHNGMLAFTVPIETMVEHTLSESDFTWPVRTFPAEKDGVTGTVNAHLFSFAWFTNEELAYDLDVDSDNSGQIATTPSPMDTEDAMEEDAPGKILIANHGDLDGDEILDYQDGFDLDGQLPDDDIASNIFARLRLTLQSTEVPIEETSVRFTYAASPPSEATFTNLVTNKLRLWRKNGNESRQVSDYIPPDVFIPATDLGFSTTVTQQHFFIEALPIDGAATTTNISFTLSHKGTEFTNELDSVSVTVLKVDFIDASGNPTDELKISKWPGAFSGGGASPTFTSAFIETDPDRFQVRVTGLANGESSLTSFLLSDHEGSSPWDDADTEITLYESSSGSGVYTSKTMVLVSNDIDDDETHQGTDGHLSGAVDDSVDDRTHIARLNSKVEARFTLGSTECKTVATVPKPKRVFLNVKILKDGSGGNAVSESRVEQMLELARELYSQVGIELEWNGGSMTISSNPPGVDLSDGIAIIDADEPIGPKGLTSEAQAIVDHLGTPNSSDDLHLFFVEPPFRSTSTALPNQSTGTGLSLNGSVAFAVDSNYLFNAFIIDEPQIVQGGMTLGAVFTLAHELGHLLGITGHETDQWRLMYGPTDRDSTDINDTMRLDTGEQTTFYGSPHVETLP